MGAAAQLTSHAIELHDLSGDPFEGGPIDPKVAAKPVYAPGEFAAVRARLLEALAGTWTPLS